MVPRILIAQTFGAVGIETKVAQLRLRSNPVELNIHSTAPRMEIESQISKVKIDQTQCFAEAGLRTPLELARVFYQNSVRMGLEAINSIAAEGLRMLNVQYNHRAIQDIAKGRGVYEKRLVTKAMPESRPKMEWDPGFLRIRWEMGEVSIDWSTQSVQYEYEPASVRIYMRQQPSIEITVDEAKELEIPIPRPDVGGEVDKWL